MQWFMYFFGGMLILGALQYLLTAPNATAFSGETPVSLHGFGSRFFGGVLLLSGILFIQGGRVMAASAGESGLWIVILYAFGAMITLAIGFKIAAFISNRSARDPNRPSMKAMPPARQSRQESTRREQSSKPDYGDWGHDSGDYDYD
jgi:hypothetical protein